MVDLKFPVLAHGLLNVALSRVSNADNIVLYLTDRQLISNPFSDKIESVVLNIVYSDALNNV
jgi:hypothetical protein